MSRQQGHRKRPPDCLANNDPAIKHQVQQESKNSSLEIVLLMDRREWNQSVSRRVFQRALERANIAYEERHLAVADIVWIIRIKGGEYTLPFLIERKTAADLARSITEPSKRYPPLTRVELQMYKMKASEIPNKIYLVQGTCNDSAEEYLKLLRRNHDDFDVRQTSDLQQTIDFIIRQHDIVMEYARQNPPTSTSLTSYFDFEERVEDALYDPSFQWKLRLQSVSGIGKLEATAIVKVYESESEFKRKIRHDGRKQVKKALTSIDIKRGHFIGNATAERVLAKIA